MELTTVDVELLLDALDHWRRALEYDRKNLPISKVANSPIVAQIKRSEQIMKKLKAHDQSFSMQDLNTMQAALGDYQDSLVKLSSLESRFSVSAELTRRINRLRRNILALLRSHSENEDLK